MERIEIPLSKAKIVFSIAGSVLFVVLGFFLFTTIAEQTARFPPIFVKGIGIASILFFGVTAIFGIRKMFDPRPGLIIDEKGIIENTNATSIGLIPWSDITEIRTEQVVSTKFLLIHIANPDQVLEKVSGMKRRVMAANMKMYGTPISIVSTTLRYDFKDLELLLKSSFEKYKTN